jgi:hypothetical protein
MAIRQDCVCITQGLVETAVKQQPVLKSKEERKLGSFKH